MSVLERASPLAPVPRPEASAPTAGPLLADISLLPRRLLVGAGVEDFLVAAGLPFPAPLAAVSAGGFDLVRTGRRQCLVIGRAAPLEVPAATPAVTALEIDQCEMVVTRTDAPDALLADICVTELARFDAAVCMPVSLAGVHAWIRRVGASGWRIVCAPADGPYLFDILHAIVCEHGGAGAGFEDAMRWLDNAD